MKWKRRSLVAGAVAIAGALLITALIVVFVHRRLLGRTPPQAMATATQPRSAAATAISRTEHVLATPMDAIQVGSWNDLNGPRAIHLTIPREIFLGMQSYLGDDAPSSPPKYEAVLFDESKGFDLNTYYANSEPRLTIRGVVIQPRWRTKIHQVDCVRIPAGFRLTGYIQIENRRRSCRANFDAVIAVAHNGDDYDLKSADVTWSGPVGSGE